MINPKALEAHGVVFFFEDNWFGTPGVDRRSEPDPTRVRSVFLALTAAEWCAIAMREGESYMGGCCGNTSAIQDEINGIFRESGYADADSLYTIGAMAQHHPDGFEEWGFLGDMTQEEFDKRCSNWSKLGPWEKIALSYQAAKDKIKPLSHRVQPTVLENRPDLDEKREIDELYASIHTARFASLFRNADSKDESGQRHASDVLTLAKMLPGTRRLLKKLEENFTTWTGVAIVEKARPEIITHNGLGLCLYNTKEDAEKVIALWRKNDDGEGLASKVLVRPATISVQKGVELG